MGSVSHPGTPDCPDVTKSVGETREHDGGTPEEFIRRRYSYPRLVEGLPGRTPGRLRGFREGWRFDVSGPLGFSETGS